METIKKTLNLNRLMTLPQAVEYFATQKERLAQPVSQVPLLAKSWQPFTVAYTGLEAAYKHAAVSLTRIRTIQARLPLRILRTLRFRLNETGNTTHTHVETTKLGVSTYNHYEQINF